MRIITLYFLTMHTYKKHTKNPHPPTHTHFSVHEEYTSSLVCAGDRLLWPKVISELEITITQRSEAEQCLILASDGMWDPHYYKMPLQRSGGLTLATDIL
jgi:hypothetical protein